MMSVQGRLILISFLARHGILIQRWTLHQRPTVGYPGYSELIRQYRLGNTMPLMQYVAQCI